MLVLCLPTHILKINIVVQFSLGILLNQYLELYLIGLGASDQTL